jgi:acetyl-CoA carboxylase biotin carboxyl carrier protein
MNYNELQDFIKAVAKSGATEVSIDSEDLKITIKTPPKGKVSETIVQQIPVSNQMPQTMPVAAPVAAPAPVATPSEDAPKAKDEDTNYITINAPMVGTFYRKPSPDKPLFVNVDDTIEPGKVICILEAMKLFNEIESEVSGRIVKVLVDDESPVEYDQPLFLVDPS